MHDDFCRNEDEWRGCLARCSGHPNTCGRYWQRCRRGGGGKKKKKCAEVTERLLAHGETIRKRKKKTEEFIAASSHFVAWWRVVWFLCRFQNIVDVCCFFTASCMCFLFKEKFCHFIWFWFYFSFWTVVHKSDQWNKSELFCPPRLVLSQLNSPPLRRNSERGGKKRKKEVPNRCQSFIAHSRARPRGLVLTCDLVTSRKKHIIPNGVLQRNVTGSNFCF